MLFYLSPLHWVVGGLLRVGCESEPGAGEDCRSSSEAGFRWRWQRRLRACQREKELGLRCPPSWRRDHRLAALIKDRLALRPIHAT